MHMNKKSEGISATFEHAVDGSENWPEGLDHVDVRFKNGFIWLTFVAKSHLGKKHEVIDNMLNRIVDASNGRIQLEALDGRYQRNLKFPRVGIDEVADAKVILMLIAGIIK